MRLDLRLGGGKVVGGRNVELLDVQHVLEHPVVLQDDGVLVGPADQRLVVAVPFLSFIGTMSPGFVPID